jgi:hypothetical protein
MQITLSKLNVWLEWVTLILVRLGGDILLLRNQNRTHTAKYILQDLEQNKLFNICFFKLN